MSDQQSAISNEPFTSVMVSGFVGADIAQGHPVRPFGIDPHLNPSNEEKADC
ncbi:MAG TPA: hypothetical protein VFL82_09845 [Thermomicrobiales bacterium]|nr:hypothetical protein [Thermomicrobiales bacterium]